MLARSPSLALLESGLFSRSFCTRASAGSSGAFEARFGDRSSYSSMAGPGSSSGSSKGRASPARKASRGGLIFRLIAAVAGGPNAATPEETKTASSLLLLKIGMIEGPLNAGLGAMCEGVTGDLSTGVPMGDELCSGTISMVGSARVSTWLYSVRPVDVVWYVLTVWVLFSLLYLLGIVGGPGMSLGKNAVMVGKLEPEGVRKDCGFLDAPFVSLPVSTSELDVFDGEHTSSELLNCH